MGIEDNLRNWRPISLFGTAYKILAKTLSLRLRALLLDIIRATQIGFAWDRSIHGNMFTFWEATYWVEESHQDMGVLLIDFKNSLAVERDSY